MLKCVGSIYNVISLLRGSSSQFTTERDADKNMQTGAANNPQVDKAEEASESTGEAGPLKKYDKERKNRSTSSEDPNIQTFGKTLKHFGLYSRLQDIEGSLEKVRRHRKSREQHELELKKLDKEILRLCQKHHPDRVKNRGGSDEEMETAKNLQASLNAVRAVLNILNKTFLDNIDVDHMYGFYTNLSIGSAGNEGEIRDHVYEVFFKISYVSEIKNQNIIPEIRKFLAAGKDCLNSFLEENVADFKKYRSEALSHLRNCTVGYKMLKVELETVEKEFKRESMDNIHELIKKLASGCSRDLHILRELKQLASESLNGTHRIFETVEPIDEYFVQPFVQYINAITIYNAMSSKKTQKDFKIYLKKIQNYVESEIRGIPCDPKDDNVPETHFSGYEQHADTLTEKGSIQKTLDKQEIRKKILECLRKLGEHLEKKFRVEDYIEGSCTNQIADDFMNCLRMMDEFEKKEKNLMDILERLENRHQDLAERLKRL